MRAALIAYLIVASAALSGCHTGLLVKRYSTSPAADAADPNYAVLKLQPFRQFQLLEVVGSNQVITGGRWHKQNGNIVLDKKRQRGFNPMPSRWVGVKQAHWRSLTMQGDSLVPLNGGKALVRE